MHFSPLTFGIEAIVLCLNFKYESLKLKDNEVLLLFPRPQMTITWDPLSAQTSNTFSSNIALSWWLCIWLCWGHQSNWKSLPPTAHLPVSVLQTHTKLFHLCSRSHLPHGLSGHNDSHSRLRSYVIDALGLYWVILLNLLLYLPSSNRVAWARFPRQLLPHFMAPTATKVLHSDICVDCLQFLSSWFFLNLWNEAFFLQILP